MLQKTSNAMWTPRIVSFFNVLMTMNKPPTHLLSIKSVRQVITKLHPAIKDPTLEHCVPRSLYAKTDRSILLRDMHALTCLPRRLNSQRSNYTLVETGPLEGWKAVGRGEHALKHDNYRLFIPPMIYRGPYARSIGYFVLTYPNYAPIVHLRVLDLRLLIQWSEEYPISHAEEYAHETIASIQDNVNPFFIDELDAYQDITSFLCDE